MNTNKKAQIIMDELQHIVGNHTSTTVTNQDQSKSKDPMPLTVQDVIDTLTEMVSENPDIAKYQIAEYSYDDFAVGPSNALFAVKGIDVIKLPEDSEDEFVDDELTSDHIVKFNIY